MQGSATTNLHSDRGQCERPALFNPETSNLIQKRHPYTDLTGV